MRHRIHGAMPSRAPGHPGTSQLLVTGRAIVITKLGPATGANEVIFRRTRQSRKSTDRASIFHCAQRLLKYVTLSRIKANSPTVASDAFHHSACQGAIEERNCASFILQVIGIISTEVRLMFSEMFLSVPRADKANNSRRHFCRPFERPI
jgi:hypothetical protein